MRSGTMARFGGMVLKSVRKTKGLHLGLFRKHTKEKKRKGAPVKVRWPLNEASAGLFMHCGHIS